MDTPCHQTAAWGALKEHYRTLRSVSLSQLFAEEPHRFNHFSLEAAGLLLDFSRHHITETTLTLLVELAQQCALPEAIESLLTGSFQNTSEDSGVLHPLLRACTHHFTSPRAVSLTKELLQIQERLFTFAEQIRQGEQVGYSGKPITDVVNIGIGGSHLGPQLVTDALKAFHNGALRIHFWANVDGAETNDILNALDPESTLFIVVSKSFSTEETLLNAAHGKAWVNQYFGVPHAFESHFVGVSANQPATQAFGILPDYYFPLSWDVGGRFSLWSAVGLAPLLAMGTDNFKRLLSGARQMDEHFHQAPLRHNMPVILGLLSVWYRNFFEAHAHAILPYDHRLKHLPGHIQQLAMESNGKQVDRWGNTVAYATVPPTWGGLGSLGQHSFYQWFHQGTDFTSADFIMPMIGDHELSLHHEWLFANCLAQSLAFLQGDGGEQDLAHAKIAGNRPCNLLLFPRLTPEILGALIALYEHKVFVEGVIWGINSFDQWGIVSGKKFARQIFTDLQQGRSESVHPSLGGLLAYYKQAKKAT